jgi:hypothetical protein
MALFLGVFSTSAETMCVQDNPIQVSAENMICCLPLQNLTYTGRYNFTLSEDERTLVAFGPSTTTATWGFTPYQKSLCNGTCVGDYELSLSNWFYNYMCIAVICNPLNNVCDYSFNKFEIALKSDHFKIDKYKNWKL